MILTEEEARKAWCPMARVLSGTASDPTSANRDDFGAFLRGSRCIASSCLMWRWNEVKRSAAFLDAVQVYMRSMDKPDFNKATQAVYADSGRQFEKTEGYCGLAGKPEVV